MLTRRQNVAPMHRVERLWIISTRRWGQLLKTSREREKKRMLDCRVIDGIVYDKFNWKRRSRNNG